MGLMDRINSRKALYLEHGYLKENLKLVVTPEVFEELKTESGIMMDTSSPSLITLMGMPVEISTVSITPFYLTEVNPWKR